MEMEVNLETFRDSSVLTKFLISEIDSANMYLGVKQSEEGKSKLY